MQAALAVLKGFGLLTGTPVQIGRDDPETLREEKEIADKQDRVQRQIRAMSPL